MNGFFNLEKGISRFYHATGWYVISQHENAIDNMKNHIVHWSQVHIFLLQQHLKSLLEPENSTYLRIPTTLFSLLL